MRPSPSSIILVLSFNFLEMVLGQMIETIQAKRKYKAVIPMTPPITKQNFSKLSWHIPLTFGKKQSVEFPEVKRQLKQLTDFISYKMSIRYTYLLFLNDAKDVILVDLYHKSNHISS